jgi:anaerobic selenocysteine-containing dehydrogenase
MCACRCGIKVHLKDGTLRYIEGNRDHPVNRGVICGKGSAGIMQHYSPARLQKPLLRVGPRGAGEFKEIEWDEALDLATEWLSTVRAKDPRKLAFFTGRDQSQALTGWWAKQFGTPNYAAHGGLCSVNMAAAGMYTIGSAFWEFSEPDWEKTEYFMMFGVAEDHGSNPIKIGLSKLKARGVKFVSVNPIQTGYSAIADEWLGITPGSDGLFVLALVHELLRHGWVDVDYLLRYSNASWLVIDDPGATEDGLIARDEEGRPLSWDRKLKQAVHAPGGAGSPALKGAYVLADGRRVHPVFHLLAERYLGERYSPAQVAAATGIEARSIVRIASELAAAAFERSIELDVAWTDAWGNHHDKMIGRPVSMHAMRGISAHANGFHTCRAIHVLQLLLGSIDVPGGLRYAAPYPKPLDALPVPCGRPDQVAPNQPLAGVHLGYPRSPEDLLVDEHGAPARIDGAYSWEAPLAAHGMMHTVIANAWRGDPYPVDVMFMYMTNMAWNSAMNTAGTIDMLTDRDAATGEYRIPKIIYSDAFASETVAYADLVLPDTTYLERWDAMSMLDRPISDADGPADAIRQPVVAPNRDVRAFQDVLLDLGARLGLPGMITDSGEPAFPDGYADYIVNHERAPGVGTLAGWRGVDGEAVGKGAPNKEQLQRYIDNGCFWREELPESAKYFRHSNADYMSYAVERGFLPSADPVVMQLYSEPLQRFRLAARGVGKVIPPPQYRQRIDDYFDPLPFWYPNTDTTSEADEYPLHALTQRPMAMYHSWGSQNAWLRQIHGDNKLYLPRGVAAEFKLAEGDWVWVVSRHGRIKVQVRPMAGVNSHTIWTWNAIGKRRGAWNLDKDSSEATKGFLLNHLIEDLKPSGQGGLSNSDPITGQAAWFDLRVRLEPVEASESLEVEPSFAPIQTPDGLAPAPVVSRFGFGGKQ